MKTTDQLLVGGFTPFSSLDYPGCLSAVVWVQGCPWRCTYCHNPHLQKRSGDTQFDWLAILNFLKRRTGLLDAVVFSGGEATIDYHLPQAMAEVRQLGFRIGLHTAGAFPARLEHVLPYVDWVGIDAKTEWENYKPLTGIRNSGENGHRALKAVLASKAEYEVRTTVHPDIISEPALLRLASQLCQLGVRRYVVQVFRSTGCNPDRFQAKETPGFPTKETLKTLRDMFDDFEFRA